MILESLRIVTDALRDPAYGVNAQLDGIPVDDEDAVPEQVVFIGDSTRDEEVAEWIAPPRVPAIYVVQASPASLEGDSPTGRRDGERIALGLWYIGRDSDRARSNTSAHYTLRAVVRTLDTLFSNVNAADRTRNSVSLIDLDSLTWGEASASIGEKGASGAVVMIARARDMAP